MKMKKVIGMLVVIIILLAMIFTAYPNVTYAANSSYTLGITNIRENKEAYGIGGLRINKIPEKKVWKIVSYTGAGNTIDRQNAFYCIKAEYGFNGFNSSTPSKQNAVTYDKKIDMKSNVRDVIDRLKAINDKKNTIKDEEKFEETYNKLIWILDNMYLPKKNDKEYKEYEDRYRNKLLAEAGINDKDVVLLTDNDIEVVQQLALWYFTNSNDKNYNGNSLQTIFYSSGDNCDAEYSSIADALNNTEEDIGTYRQEAMGMLYNYFIENAKKHQNYLDSEKDTANPNGSPITVDVDRAEVKQEKENYIVGPFKIDVNTTGYYDIEKLTFVDQSKQEINLTGVNQLLNSEQEVVSSGDIKEMLNKDFYISLPIKTTITDVEFNFKIAYPNTQETFYTTEDSTYLLEQPVVLVERKYETISGEKKIPLPGARQLDLALRKSITKINNVAPTVSRVPQVDATGLVAGETTAKYNHPKNDLITGTNQMIEYTMTVYNEGKKNGYALEIKDYLPAGIEFVELVSPQDKYKAVATKNENGTSTVTITNTGKNELTKYTTGTPASEAVTIRCKVTAEAGTTDKRLVNIAEITKYYDSESNIEKTTDIDSRSCKLPR